MARVPTLRDVLGHAYPESMRIRSYSPHTIETQVMLAGWFADFAAARGITDPAAVTKALVDRYQAHLYSYRSTQTTRQGEPLSIRSQHARLWAVLRFFRWMVRTDRLAGDPAAHLELPRLPRPAPKPALSFAQIEAVLAKPDVGTAAGLRDRVMMEVFYATGLRRGELCRLTVDDIDQERGMVTVRIGKGGHGRAVPISRRALSWVARYVRDVWSRWPAAFEHRRLFITVEDGTKPRFQGAPMQEHNLTRIMGCYVAAAGIGAGACHIFRRTAATHLMEGGADPRVIQDFLGHADLRTTGVYTNVSTRFLQAEYAKAHPSAAGMPGRVPLGGSGETPAAAQDAPP